MLVESVGRRLRSVYLFRISFIGGCPNLVGKPALSFQFLIGLPVVCPHDGRIHMPGCALTFLLPGISQPFHSTRGSFCLLFGFSASYLQSTRDRYEFPTQSTGRSPCIARVGASFGNSEQIRFEFQVSLSSERGFGFSSFL